MNDKREAALFALEALREQAQDWANRMGTCNVIPADIAMYCNSAIARLRAEQPAPAAPTSAEPVARRYSATGGVPWTHGSWLPGDVPRPNEELLFTAAQLAAARDEGARAAEARISKLRGFVGFEAENSDSECTRAALRAALVADDAAKEVWR